MFESRGVAHVALPDSECVSDDEYSSQKKESERVDEAASSTVAPERRFAGEG